MKFRELKLRRDPACPICGDNPTIKELIDYDQFCGIQPAPAEPVGNPVEVTVQDMKKALAFLHEQGFIYLKSVKGGITVWSE